jgi:hypothetical protein
MRLGAHPERKKCPAWPGGSGLLKDGDFHEAVYPGSWQDFTNGQRFAPDWLVTKRSIDLNGTYFMSPDGICAVDLDGYEPGAIVHRAFATTPSASYTVTFLFSGNGSNYPTIKKIRVEAAGQSETLTWDISNGHDAQHGDFDQESWAFVAMSSRTRLRFRSLDTVEAGYQNGPVVAAISVTQSTP